MKNLVEVLLFATPKPLTQARFNQITHDLSYIDLQSLIDELNVEYEETGKGLIIRRIGGGYQILSLPEYHIFVERLFNKSRQMQLSRPSLEALSIIAYQQPITKSDIEFIRGVECGSVISTLMERQLITVKGRGKTTGRPLLFGTTGQFLEVFGLEKVSDLPKIKELSDIIKDNQEKVVSVNDYEIE